MKRCKDDSTGRAIWRIYLVLIAFLSAETFAQDWLYKVQPGDNLWNLSEKYLVSMSYWRELQELNQIPDPEHLRPNTKLRIPLDWMKSSSTLARVSSVKGDVVVVERVTGQERAAAVDMELYPRDQIRTGPDTSAVLVFPDGSKILVHPNSNLRLESIKAYGDSGMVDTQLRLDEGRSDNKVRSKSGPGSRFEISTPAAVMGVRGTEYRISTANAGSESRAEVLQGEVDVTTGNASALVPEGFGIVAAVGQEGLTPVPLLPSPDTSELPSLVDRLPVWFRLRALEGAVAYRLQVAVNKDFDTFLFDRRYESTRVEGVDLPDGDYVLRVRGVDENGVEGRDALHSFTLDARPVPPIRIKPLAGAVVTDPHPVFQWSAPENVSGYHFQLAKTEDFETPLIDIANHDNPALKPEQPLEPGVYYWRVAARDREGRPGPLGDAQSFRRPPPGPDKLGEPEIDEEGLVLRWRAGKPGQQFRIQLATEASFTKILEDARVLQSQYRLSRPEPGKYYIRVGVIDTDGFEGPFGPHQVVDVPGPDRTWVLGVAFSIWLLLVL